MSSEGPKWPKKEKYKSHKRNVPGGSNVENKKEARDLKVSERIAAFNNLRPNLAPEDAFIFGGEEYTFKSQDTKTGLVRCRKVSAIPRKRITRDIDPRGITEVRPRLKPEK